MGEEEVGQRVQEGGRMRKRGEGDEVRKVDEVRVVEVEVRNKGGRGALWSF